MYIPNKEVDMAGAVNISDFETVVTLFINKISS